VTTALIALAAETAGEHADHTLFYVVGGLAALYGVVIAIIGIKKPDFPKTQGAARGVFALSTVIVAAAMASAVIAA
jgi:hypothetical protein